MRKNHSNYLKLAFNLAKINLGKTKENPSVGCVVVKNQSVISSGYTSINGRPHAEFNALNKKIDFKNSDIYITMEPCTHTGKTPPCTNIIKKKGIKKVFFAFNDVDKRTAFTAKKILLRNKIKIQKINISAYKNFYDSYFTLHKSKLPFVDAKLAISKDFLTIKKKSKWITNELARKNGHLLRSQYDCIISTSKTINKDNSLLNCRINGLNQNKPDLIIIDIKSKLRKKLRLFKKPNKRKIYLITSFDKNNNSIYFKNKNVKIIKLSSLLNKNDFMNLLILLKKKGYNRILVETGLKFLNELLKFKLINNLYLFQSLRNLGKKGKNNTSNKAIKKFILSHKVKINLNGDNLYKIKIKNV